MPSKAPGPRDRREEDASVIEIRWILCPVDFSECSRHALSYALTLARWYESTITVFHTYTATHPLPIVPYDGPPALEPLGLSETHREQLRQALQEFTAPLAGSGVQLSIEIGEGLAVEQIAGRARTLSADLIVMGTHGRSGFERLFLGSVTERVLRKASCPVLTVPPRVAGATPTFRRILCAVDFSDSSLRALQFAVALAEEADARLSVLHVLELLPEGDAPELGFLSLREYRERLEATARERLRAAVPDSARQFADVDERVTIGKPYREILRTASEQGVELIVMGVRGRSGVDLMMFGSTTQHVVRQAVCPVLTVRTG
ncbi:MAG TPA: universal stress protein [Vicinamibacterales bacterium]|nr:universal stress protein [Vicinamibacterales bacterium]